MAENLVIVGSGPAGLTAGIYAARAGFSPLVLEGMLAGGQLTQTTEIENYPGFANPIGGLELMAAMRSQAERCGVRFAMDEVEKVDFSGDGERRLFGMAGDRCVREVDRTPGRGEVQEPRGERVRDMRRRVFPGPRGGGRRRR